MAKSFTSSTIMALAFLALIVSPAFADNFEILTPPSSAPINKDVISPAPEADPMIMECAAKLTLDCAAQMLSGEFEHHKIDLRCCKQIVNMGDNCAFYLISEAVNVFRDPKSAARTLGDGDQLWHRCVSFVKSAGGGHD